MRSRRTSGRPAYQPTRRRARLLRSDLFRGPRRDPPARRDAIDHAQVVVSAEDDAESASLRDEPRRARRARSRSPPYAELALAPAAADAVPPAFSKLFVQTDFRAGARRDPGDAAGPREPRRKPIWVAHVSGARGVSAGACAVRDRTARVPGARAATSARRRLDRGRAAAVEHGRLGPRSDREPSPPSCALPPGATARIHFATIAAASREQARRAAPTSTASRPPSSAPPTSHGRRRRCSCAHLGDLRRRGAPSSSGSRRGSSTPIPRSAPPRDVLAAKPPGAVGLWPHGISGDLPIVLLRDRRSGRPRHRPPAALRAHVLEAEGPRGGPRSSSTSEAMSYGRDLRETLESLVRARRQGAAGGRGPGGQHLSCCGGTCSPPEDRDLLRAAARVVLLSQPRDPLRSRSSRLLRRGGGAEPPARPAHARGPPTRHPDAAAGPARFFNGLGGFAEEAARRDLVLGEGRWTPAPRGSASIANPLRSGSSSRSRDRMLRPHDSRTRPSLMPSSARAAGVSR